MNGKSSLYIVFYRLPQQSTKLKADNDYSTSKWYLMVFYYHLPNDHGKTPLRNQSSTNTNQDR